MGLDAWSQHTVRPVNGGRTAALARRERSDRWIGGSGRGWGHCFFLVAQGQAMLRLAGKLETEDVCQIKPPRRSRLTHPRFPARFAYLDRTCHKRVTERSCRRPPRRVTHNRCLSLCTGTGRALRSRIAVGGGATFTRRRAPQTEARKYTSDSKHTPYRATNKQKQQRAIDQRTGRFVSLQNSAKEMSWQTESAGGSIQG